MKRAKFFSSIHLYTLPFPISVLCPFFWLFFSFHSASKMKRCKLFSFWSKGWKQGWSWFCWLLQIESEWCGSDLEIPGSYSLHKITSGSKVEREQFLMQPWLIDSVCQSRVCPVPSGWGGDGIHCLSLKNRPRECLTAKTWNVLYKTNHFSSLTVAQTQHFSSKHRFIWWTRQ